MRQSHLTSTLMSASSTEGRRLVLERMAGVPGEMTDRAARRGELSLQGRHSDRKCEGTWACTAEIVTHHLAKLSSQHSPGCCSATVVMATLGGIPFSSSSILVPCMEGDRGGPGPPVWPSEGNVTWGVPGLGPGPAIQRRYFTSTKLMIKSLTWISLLEYSVLWLGLDDPGELSHTGAAGRSKGMFR